MLIKTEKIIQINIESSHCEFYQFSEDRKKQFNNYIKKASKKLTQKVIKGYITKFKKFFFFLEIIFSYNKLFFFIT